MREIKFRAWHRGEQCWHYFQLIGVKVYPQVESALRYQNRCVWTGLKDKNGVNIYEGDVLSFVPIDSSKYRKPFRPFLVEWLKDEARFLDWSPRGDVEVIGNIHENPELL